MTIRCPKCHFNNPEDTIYCGKCAAPLSSSKEFPPSFTETFQASLKELTTGSTFAGRYQIIEELGHGGMGRVYKVFDTDIKEKIALKLLRPEIALDKETVERFSNELRLARKISHRNVCRMFDLGKAEGTTFITMEFVAGEDLKKLIRKMGQVGSGRAVSIAKQVCEGLAEAHHIGIVHRDLKPQNIMVDEDGNARIMDFGIARSLRGKGITGAGVMIGTPEYMSPEQVEGKDTDQRSDIYSLGVILYEMVMGKVPFEGDTPLTIAVKHKSEMPKSLREHNAQISEDLNRLVLRCLEKDREKRYQSVEELRSELERIEQEIPTTQRIFPSRKPLTSREITVKFNLRKLLLPSLVVAALVAAAVIIWRLLPRKEALLVPSGKPSIAVVYFKNNTGDENFDHWRTALSDLLIADLAQSKYIRVLSGDSLYDTLRQLDLLEARSYSREELKQVASRGGVNHILQGDLSKAGDNFRINMVLQKADTGDLVASESVDGKGEGSFLSMVDELTRRIKADFRLSVEEIAADIDKKVEEITTSSPQALKYYTEGRDLHYQAEFRKSIQMMEKALAIDPGFAMAYRSMAMAYSNLLMFSDSKKYLQKAFELKDRLSDRERYLIEGEFYRYSEVTYDRAIEAYTNLFQLYPDDPIGNTNLGNLYLTIEQWDKAIERFNIEVQNKEESFFPYTNIAESYRAKGMHETARKVLEDYVQNVQESGEIRRQLAFNYLLQGEYRLALIESDKALSLNPDDVWSLIAKGNVYLCTEDFPKAEEAYLKALGRKELGYHLYARVVLGGLNLLQGKYENARQHDKQGLELAEKLGDNWWRICIRGMLAYNLLRSGRAAEALKECDMAMTLAPDSDDSLRWQRRALYWKGRALLAMNSAEAARKTADNIKELVDKGANKKEIRYYHHLMGLVELEKKDYAKAIERFNEAVSLSPYEVGLEPFTNDQSIFAEPLAAAYYASGNKEKAREEYEKILTMAMGKLYYGDIFARSLYWLGKISEEKGLKSKAVEYYERFLTLWKDAGPGVPEVGDARKRMAALLAK